MKVDIFEGSDMEIIEQMISVLGEENFAQLQESTYCYRIIVSMYYLGTTNPQAIIQDIYNDFNGACPMDSIEYIIRTYLPMVLSDNSIIDINGVMTPDAIQLAIDHNEYLQLNKVKSKKHLH